MKMTELAEDETESVDLPDEFFDDFENNDFLDEIVNIVIEHDKASNKEQANLSTVESVESDDDQLIHDAHKLTESFECHKRKLRNSKWVDNSKKWKEHRSSTPIRSTSPTANILKQAVERIKSSNNSFDDTNDETDSNFGTFSTSNGSTTGNTSNTVESVEIQIPNRSLCTSIETKTIQQIRRIHCNQPHLQKLVNDINNGFKVMVIMRGSSGCGKSHLARDIIDITTKDSYSDHIFSSCDFFYNQKRCFIFNPAHIAASHQWNQSRVRLYATFGWSPIIVDNTNIKKWEMNNYVKIAVEFGYLIEIVQPDTPWSKSVDELVSMNIHVVPKKMIQLMLLNYEPTTVNDLMESNALKYTMLMPQYRLLPDVSQRYL